jgi:16S rRNA (uracil1498-N3)-methyltransferase
MTGHTPRFYAHKQPVEGVIVLTPEQVRHSKALRMKDGDKLQLFDEKHDYEATLEGTNARILSKSEHKASGAEITLAISWPKGPRGDWLVEKATELGVRTIIPLLVRHSVVEPGSNKVERLRKVAINAAEQSGARFPTITEPKMLRDVLADPYDFIVIADASGTPLTKDRLRSHTKGASTASPFSNPAVLALVGPEGGFTSDEIQDALAKDAMLASLGHTTLRTETAGIVLTTLLSSLYAP